MPGWDPAEWGLMATSLLSVPSWHLFHQLGLIGFPWSPFTNDDVSNLAPPPSSPTPSKQVVMGRAPTLGGEHAVQRRRCTAELWPGTYVPLVSLCHPSKSNTIAMSRVLNSQTLEHNPTFFFLSHILLYYLVGSWLIIMSRAVPPTEF